METTGHNKWKILLFVLKATALIITVILNFIQPVAPQLGIDIFKNSVGNVSDKYVLEITPAGWTFSIWSFIYAYQFALVGYEASTIFRRGPEGPIYTHPGHLTPLYSLFYIINLACNISWLFAFDREWIDAALGLLMVIAGTLYVCLGLSMRSLAKNADYLLLNNLKREIHLTIALVHNGIGMYAAWTTIASLLNLGIVISYSGGMKQELASSIVLGALAFVVVVYAVLDLVIFPHHFRFLFSPLIVLHVALIGSLQKNWDAGSHNMLFELGLMSCGFFLLVTKCILGYTRSRNSINFKVHPKLEAL